MVNIAVLGYGTVGSGVVEVLQTNKDSINMRAGKIIQIKYVLDLREFPGSPIENVLTHDVEEILNDPDVQVVVEVMGGIEPAYTFVKRALLSGKSVVTSNKELVAKFGAELLEIAKNQNINFLFEASVGGGIPIIRPLNNSLTADEIYEITGILNGTTNFILTKMAEEGEDFETVLKEAQDLGYAERHPEADVEGYDACRKIAILSSLAFGMQVDYEDIYTEGITKITKADIEYAKSIEKEIKLLATSKKVNGHVYAKVTPVLLERRHPLATVNGVFNAIFVKGNVIGDVMFYGKGAGKLPTASAVVADVVDAVKHLERNIMSFWSTEKMDLLQFEEIPAQYFVRLQVEEDKDSVKKELEDIDNVERILELDEFPKELGFITQRETEGILQDRIRDIEKLEGVKSLISIIRVE